MHGIFVSNYETNITTVKILSWLMLAYERTLK